MMGHCVDGAIEPVLLLQLIYRYTKSVKVKVRVRVRVSVTKGQLSALV